MCSLETLRQLDVARQAGRVRRMPKFRHYLMEACPELEEGMIGSLACLGGFGPNRVALQMGCGAVVDGGGVVSDADLDLGGFHGW
jgi:hypothetical protein